MVDKSTVQNTAGPARRRVSARALLILLGTSALIDAGVTTLAMAAPAPDPDADNGGIAESPARNRIGGFKPLLISW